ncbi:MAG: hypothetical protein ACT4PP_12635 [Sporichthyaceae bacterium]
MGWFAVSVGGALAVLGLLGIVAGVSFPGLGSRVEPRLDGLGYLLIAGCLLVNGGRDATDSDSTALGTAGSLLGVAGIIVLIAARRRANGVAARKARLLRRPPPGT